MRVALVVHKYPPESLGGVEIYSETLAKALARAGHEVHIFYPAVGELAYGTLQGGEQDVIGPDLDGNGGIHLWRVSVGERASGPRPRPENPLKQYWHTFRDTAIESDFQRFLDETGAEVVHFQHVQGVSARLLEIASDRPVVLTLHDFWFFCFNSQLLRPEQVVCGGPRFGWNCVDCATVRPDLRSFRMLRPLVALPLAYRNWYLRRAIANVALFIAPSEFLRGQYLLQGFPSDRIRTLENGLDVERLAEEPAESMPKPTGRPHFGYIGALAWHKGVHVLLDAFNRLPPSAALTVYGGESSFPEYARHLKELARHSNVRFAGRLDHRYVGVALRQLDCLVVPSLWYENSPLVIQESFAAGVPVIASRLGALEEKVQDGVTGSLFPAGDSEALASTMLGLVNEPARLRALAANVRPGPTIQQHAEILTGIYRSLLS